MPKVEVKGGQLPEYEVKTPEGLAMSIIVPRDNEAAAHNGAAGSGRIEEIWRRTRTRGARVGHEFSHAVELLVARKDQEAVARLPPLVIFFLDLVNELPHEVEDAVARPGFFPQVPRGVPLPRWWNGRIAGTAELALVSGRNRVCSRLRCVVTYTRSGSTAKCARHLPYDSSGSRGSRVVWYCRIPSWTSWPAR